MQAIVGQSLRINLMYLSVLSNFRVNSYVKNEINVQMSFNRHERLKLHIYTKIYKALDLRVSVYGMKKKKVRSEV